MVDRSVSVALQAKVSGFVAGINTARTAVTGFAAELEKSAAKRKALNDLGNAAGKVGFAAAAGLGAAVLAAANFDQAMSRVKGATGDSTKQMDLLRAAAIKAGQDTVFSATEAAAGEEELAKAGVKTKDILSGGLTGALNLASAGTIGVGQAAEIAASTMNQFGLKGTQVAHIADVLAAAAGKAQGDVTDVATALKYVGPVAAQMGVSLEQTTGTIGLLASQGVLASQAGTSLRGMLSTLTSPSKVAAAEMKKLGIDVFDTKGQFIGFDGVAQQLHDHLSSLTQAQRADALGRIFSNQQLVAANILYKAGGQAVDAWTKKVNDSGYAQQLAATKMNNLKGDLEQLRGSLETALIGTGEGAQGPLRSIVQDLTGMVNAYSKLPGPTKQAVGSILGFTAAAGGSIWAVTHLVTGIASMRDSLSTLNSSFGSANKGMLAFRTASAAAGIGLLAIGGQIDSTHHDLGMLAKVAGGAALGFAAGGPWGAAIGGGISLLASFAGANANAAGEVAALTATLNAQTGAITGNTRQWVAQKLETTGVLKSAQSLGIDMSMVTRAAMGNGAAMAYLTRQLAEYEAAARAKGGGNTPEYQRVKDMQALITALKDQRNQINGVVQARRREIQASESAQSVMQGLAQTYNLTPKQVRTAILQDNMGKSQSDIAQLLHQYGLTPKQVQTFLKAIDNASPVLQHVGSELSGLNGRTATTYVVTRHQTTYSSAGGHSAPDPGMPHATGGYIRGPGTTTSDSIPVLLSDKEYVINAAAVAKYGVDFFHRANAMRLAGGGPVGGSGSSGSNHLTPAQQEIRKARAEAAKRHAEHMAALHKQLDTTQKQLQAAVQFNQSVQQNFRVDPFQSNFTLQGVMASLQSDTARAHDFTGAVRRAKRLGLSGGVFRALLASGDTSVLEGITTRSQVNALEHAWAARNKATADLTFGMGASGKFAGDTLNELRQEVAHLRHELHHLGHHVEKGAEKGTHRGTRDHAKHRRNVTRQASRQ